MWSWWRGGSGVSDVIEVHMLPSDMSHSHSHSCLVYGLLAKREQDGCKKVGSKHSVWYDRLWWNSGQVCDEISEWS